MPFSTEFGFLPKPIAFDVGEIRVHPRSDHAELLKAVEEHIHEDGHFYPPETEKVRLPDWPDTERREPIPNTRRPAHLFTLPTSHVLELTAPDSDDALGGDASFVVQTLAYVYGIRLQPAGWQFDGRVPIARPTRHSKVDQAALERFVTRAYAEWRAQPMDRRLRLTNVLYMHAKAPSYDWIWEQFFIQYLVTDALYEYCARTGLAVSVSHEERIRELCGRLGVWCPPEAPVCEMVEMRNSLFHEALWEGERPGYKISAEAYYRVREFRELNHRLLAAVLGGSTSYTTHPWTDWRQMVEFA